MMHEMIVNVCIGISGLLIGILIGGFYMGHKYCVKYMGARTLAENYRAIIRLYDVWMMTKKSDITIEDRLREKGIKRIGIYGMDYKGIRLFHELKDASIEVVYGMDRNPAARIADIRTYHPDDYIEEQVDAIIVTAIIYFDAIKKDLEGKGYSKIIALDELLYSLI